MPSLTRMSSLIKFIANLLSTNFIGREHALGWRTVCLKNKQTNKQRKKQLQKQKNNNNKSKHKHQEEERQKGQQ